MKQINISNAKNVPNSLFEKVGFLTNEKFGNFVSNGRVLCVDDQHESIPTLLSCGANNKIPKSIWINCRETNYLVGQWTNPNHSLVWQIPVMN